MAAKETKPLISVIIPVYNAESYLKQCLDSILKQDYENLEVILIDDGSKDQSGKICDAYASKDNRFHVLHQANAGMGAALDAGIQHMHGRYVTFVDDDDWLDPDYFSFFYEKTIGHDYDIIMVSSVDHYEDTGKVEYDNGGKDRVFTPAEAVHDLLTDHAFVTEAMSQKLYKASLFDNYHLQHGRNYLDTSTFMELMTRCKGKCAYFNSCKYHYRIRRGSITHSGYTDSSVEQVMMYTEHAAMIQKYFPSEMKYLSHYIVSVSMSSYMKMVIENKEAQYPKDIAFYFDNFHRYKPVFQWNVSKAGLYAEWILAKVNPGLLHQLIVRNRKRLAPIVNAVIES